MSVEPLLAQFHKTGEVHADLESAIREPQTRRQLCRHIVEGEVLPYRLLLIRMFEEEISYRKAGRSSSYGDGLYHCAFLLSRCGNPRDTAVIWKAQYLDQDIGELDARFFVGAGYAETVKFLNRSREVPWGYIADHIRGDSWAQGDLTEWEQQWRESIRDA